MIQGAKVKWGGACLMAGILAIFMAGSTNATESKSKQGVTGLLQKQSDAWNKGDLDTFLTGYLDSPDISFVSAGIEQRGYDALRDRYRRKYGTNKDSMGQLSFSDLEIQDLGRVNALCIGHWHLERQNQPAVGGMFSLVLVKSSDGWKIIHDHTSTIESKQ